MAKSFWDTKSKHCLQCEDGPIFRTDITDLFVQGHQTEMPEDYQQRFSDILICFEVRRGLSRR
jgi:hypothetical protein